MSKRFWQRGPVSKMLKKPKQAIKQTFLAVRGRKPEFEALLEALPEGLASLEKGLVVLDGDFPIREGHSRIDVLAINAAQELTFVWVKRVCNAETISKLLPDYDWIQKNQALWAHLFPQVLESRSMQMRVWVFALEIDPEVGCLLNYLQGVRIRLFQSSPRGGGAGWVFTSWDDLKKTAFQETALPSSPTVLKAVPALKPATAPAHVRHETTALLSHEEIQDLIGLAPVDDVRQEDEVTDPFYDQNLQENEA